jgi:hypothetical protein
MDKVRYASAQNASQLRALLRHHCGMHGDTKPAKVRHADPASTIEDHARRFVELFARADRANLQSREAREMFRKFMESRLRERQLNAASEDSAG